MKKIVESQFKVVCVKNGYSSGVQVKGSGYRDLKFLVEVEFDKLNLRKVPQVQGKIKLICEIQVICDKWLRNKKTTSLSYKVLRASSLKEFLDDFAKYLDRNGEGKKVTKIETKKVLKNGWLNLARMINFSTTCSKDDLIDACIDG